MKGLKRLIPNRFDFAFMPLTILTAGLAAMFVDSLPAEISTSGRLGIFVAIVVAVLAFIVYPLSVQIAATWLRHPQPIPSAWRIETRRSPFGWVIGYAWKAADRQEGAPYLGRRAQLVSRRRYLTERAARVLIADLILEDAQISGDGVPE